MAGDPSTSPVRIERTTRLIAAIGLAGLIALAGLTIADVLLRWLFAAPIDGAGEVSKLLIAVVIASFFPAGLAERQHIVIDFAAKVLGPRIDRGLAIFADLITFAFFVVMVWRFVLYTAELTSSGETTWTLGWTVAPWWMVVTVILAGCLPVQAVVLYRTARGRTSSAAAGDERGGAT